MIKIFGILAVVIVLGLGIKLNMDTGAAQVPASSTQAPPKLLPLVGTYAHSGGSGVTALKFFADNHLVSTESPTAEALAKYGVADYHHSATLWYRREDSSKNGVSLFTDAACSQKSQDFVIADDKSSLTSCQTGYKYARR